MTEPELVPVVLIPEGLAVRIRHALIEHEESELYDELADCAGYPEDEDGPL